MTAEQKFWKLCRRPIEFTVDIEEIDIACGREPGHEGRCTMDREELITKLYFLIQNASHKEQGERLIAGVLERFAADIAAGTEVVCQKAGDA